MSAVLATTGLSVRFVRFRDAEAGGNDLGEMAQNARAQLGLSRTWQSTELLDDLTSQENITVAADKRLGGTAAAEFAGKRR